MNEIINGDHTVYTDHDPASLNGAFYPESPDPITLFLSNESIARHREYHRELRLKYSILQKSEMLLNSTDIHKIPWQKLDADLCAEAFSLLCEYTLHTVFFSSFTENPTTGAPVPIHGINSASELLNHLFRLGKSDNIGGFLVLLRGKRGIAPARIYPPYRELKSSIPLLAVDLFEHSYFYDYGFDRGRYLYAALSHLDLNSLV